MNKINLGTHETFHCRTKDEYSFDTKKYMPHTIKASFGSLEGNGMNKL